MDNEMEISSNYCPVCTIRKRTDNNFQPKHGKALTAAETQNLICKYASASGCINTKPCSTEELSSATSWDKRAALTSSLL
jgi:hypothetical protein